MTTALIVVAAAVGLRPNPSAAEAPQPADGKIDIGLQLYSLRARMPKDLDGTLAMVQKWGVTDVEAAGLEKLGAEQFHQELQKHGLRASGIHFQWDRFSNDLDGIVRDAKTLGCSYVTLPWIPHKGDFTAADAREAAGKFNQWGRKLKEAGLAFTYHAHGYEFRPVEHGTLFDIMAGETKPEWVNFELDIFWAFDAGVDPVQLMEQYPSRFLLMHLKDMKKGTRRFNYTGHEVVEADVTLGQGQLDLPAILREARGIGVKHYYIEDESSRSVEQVPRSIEYIRSIGF